MKFFLLNFLNVMSCKNRNKVMLVNIFFKIFFQFFKIWVTCPFKALDARSCVFAFLKIILYRLLFTA